MSRSADGSYDWNSTNVRRADADRYYGEGITMSRLQRLLLVNSAVVLAVALTAAGAGAKSTSGSSAEAAAKASAASRPDAQRNRGDSRSPSPEQARTRVRDLTTATAAADSVVVPVTSGSFRFSGTGGDYISWGQSYSYSHPTDSFHLQTDVYEGKSTVQFSVQGANRDWWNTIIKAPNGADLAVGRYEFSREIEPDKPFMSLGGNGRGCGSRGYFEIHQIALKADRTVEAIDLTFVQHCELDKSFSYGHLLINASALPHQPVDISFDVDAQASMESRKIHSGYISQVGLSGQVSCTGSANLVVTGGLFQTRDSRTTILSVPASTTACAVGKPVSWRAEGTAEFQAGTAEAKASVTAYDPYSVTVAQRLPTDSTTLTMQTSSVKLDVASASLRLGGDFAHFQDRSGRTYSKADYPIEVWSDGTYLYLDTGTSSGVTAYLATVGNGKLAVGKYDNAVRFDTGSVRNNSTNPSIATIVPTSACWTATGSFEVHQVAYKPDGSLSGLDATFEHRCDGKIGYGHLLVNMAPLQELNDINGGVYFLDGFSKRTFYGMNNGGNLHGYVTCSKSAQLKLTGIVTQNGATVPFSTTVDCITGSTVKWKAFGTQLSQYGFTDGTATVNLTVVLPDPYLAAYRIGFSQGIPLYV